MKKKQQKTLQRSTLTASILAAMGSVHAATINVDGSCTLVDAIQAANTDAVVGSCTAGSGDDVIQVVTPDSNITINTVFGASTVGPGNTGLPTINSTVTIEGNGMTLQSDNYAADNFRLLEVDSLGDLTLRDTTVQNADDGYGVGSGLLSYGGRVTIENSTFALNNGAILLANSLNNEINNSVIRHNKQTNSNAAGLSTYFAGVDINNSSIIENKHISANYFRGVGTIAGGVGFTQSEVTITNSTISGNESLYGAGMFINDDNPPPVPSKFPRFENSAMRGVINSEVTITNSTITNNKAYLAAGILEVGEITTLTFQGSIVAGNKIYNNGYYTEIFSVGNGVINTDANNIFGEQGNPGVYNVPMGPSDITFSNAAEDNLYPLTVANGQLMHPLKVGSVAIDGNDLSCFGSILDQEGKGRGKDGDNNGSFVCDIGSFEHTLPIVVTGSCDFNSALLSAENDASINGCQPGKGHDIIMMPENSVNTFNNAVDQPDIGYYNPYFQFGIPGINTAVTIEANGSTFARDVSASDAFDLFLVDAGGQLNLIDATVTGANGGLGAVSSWYGGNINVINSVISNNQSQGVFDIQSINSSVVNSTISLNTPTNYYGAGQRFGALTSLVSAGFNLQKSTISNNSGGYCGLDLRNVAFSSVENTTVSNNSGYLAGVIATGYSTQVEAAAFRNNTITENSGGNVGGILSFIYAPDGLRLSHTIVSGNTQIVPPSPNQSNGVPGLLGRHQLQSVARGPVVVNEIYSSSANVVLDDYNIIGQNGDSSSVGITIGASDIVPAGPTSSVIEPLADNGGDTLTHMPVDGGIAVDGGDIYCGLNDDQLGRIRPWDGDGDNNDRCDMGSVERGSVAASDLIFKDGFDDAVIILKRKRIID